MSLRKCLSWISAGLCGGVMLALIAPAPMSGRDDVRPMEEFRRSRSDRDADRREIADLQAKLKQLADGEGDALVETVAVRAETNPKPIAALADVRAARAAAKRRSAEVRASLEQIDRRTERRVLSEGLATVCGLAASDHCWPETAKAARVALAQLNDPRLKEDREFESAEFRERLAEARKLLSHLQEQAASLSAIAGLTAALGELDRKPDDEAAILLKVDRDALPQSLAHRVNYLHGWAEIRGTTAARWEKAPEVNAIKASVERLESGLGEVSKDDLKLGKRLLLDLAVKALLEGYPETALALLPEDAPGDHAAKLLRDLRSLALGEGKVTSWPATSDTSARPPKGLQPLLPEAARKGWRPPEKEKADPTPVERAEQLARMVKSQAAKATSKEKASAETNAAEATKALTALRLRVLAPEQAERKKLVAVEAELDRRLQPAERVRARAMLAQQKTARQIAAELAAQAPAEEDESMKFLADVERRLGRPLRREESGQASRLRQQGRTGAEVADLLRR